MLSSMTGFGRSEGVEAGGFWVWAPRRVNGRGLEVRWRLPAGFDGMEPGLREALAAQLRARSTQQPDSVNVERALMCRRCLKRGSVQVSLTVRSVAAALLVLNESALNHVLQVAMDLAARVPGAPVPRVERLVMARQGEGLRLGQVLLDLVGQMSVLGAEAEAEAEAEVAVVASRSDVPEDLDRLGSHIEAVLALFEAGGSVGRQLDCLVQEPVRETNTICSKSASRALSLCLRRHLCRRADAFLCRRCLGLKGVVEQVQNLE